MNYSKYLTFIGFGLLVLLILGVNFARCNYDDIMILKDAQLRSLDISRGIIDHLRSSAEKIIKLEERVTQLESEQGDVETSRSKNTVEE